MVFLTENKEKTVMLQQIKNTLILNPSLEDIRNNPNHFFAIDDADNEKHNALKKKLTPVYTTNKPSAGKNFQYWVGTNGNISSLFSPEPLHRFCVISYHTPDKLYKEGAERLKESLDAFNIEYIIEERPSLGSWEDNCAQKPRFIYEKWQETSKPVVWIDSDAVLRSYPYLFDSMEDIDFAIHKKEHWEFLSGGCYFNRTDAAQKLLKLWIKSCEDNPRIWDQMHLDFAWHTLYKTEEITTAWLPSEYTKIFDDNSDTKAVIEQFQASRQLDEIDIKKKPKYRKLRKKQRYFRKNDLTPPPISLADKFLDLFNGLKL